MKVIKFLLIFCISVVFISGCEVSDKLKEAEPLSVSENNFNLKEFGSTKYMKLSDFAGKPVFIDFWATWCPPCRYATPYVKKIDMEFKDNVQVIGISLDNNISVAQNYIGKNSVGYLQLEGAGTDVPRQYGVSGIPAFFIIDAQGEIVKKYVGFSPKYYDEWVEVLASLIE